MEKKKNPDGDEELTKEQFYQKSFIQVKKFTNLYKDKMVIMNDRRQTVVDKMNGDNEHFKKGSNIDFDF